MVTFYPASGCRLQTSGAFAVTGATGYCWQSAVTGANGYYLNLNNTNVNPTNNTNRAYGFPVRCVQNLLLFKLYPLGAEGDLACKRAVTLYPASGYRLPNSGAFNVTGSNGYCWQSAVTGANGYFLNFNNTNVNPTNNNERARGLGVRCVQHLQLF